MDLELLISDSNKHVKLLEQNNNLYKIQVDDQIYEVDVMKTSQNVYSIIHENKSFNVELSPVNDFNHEYSTTLFNVCNKIKVLDAQAKYQLNRQKGNEAEDSNIIASPMPGQIIKIPVKVGDKVKPGDIIIIVEAMKMQSEYKAINDKTVKEILVKEGDNITSNQQLVILE